MPSGAKKRKAAKRKKERQEKEKATGGIPDPPLSPVNGPPPSPPAPPQPRAGNGPEDRAAPDDDVKERGSGEVETPFATPLSQVDGEGGEGIPGSECVAADGATESSENDKREADELKVQGMAAAAAAAALVEEEEEEEALPALPTPKDESGVGIAPPGRGGPCDAEGAEESVVPVEWSVVASYEVKRENEPLAEKSVVASEVASAAVDPPPSHESEVKVVPPPDEDAVEEQPRVGGEANQGTVRAEAVRTTEIVSPAPLVVHRARWWDCCGLLDALVRSEK